MKVTKKDLHRKIKLARVITKVMTADVNTDDYEGLLNHIEAAKSVMDNLEIFVKIKMNESKTKERVA